ncbi:DUF7386 family protein [Halorubrum californiense]
MVIDAALAHPFYSEENICEARDELDPAMIQKFNTAVLGLRYRRQIESKWR